MGEIRFTCDPRKMAASRRKQGVSYDEARSVFVDENAKSIDDPDHSAEENRFILLGLSHSLRLLFFVTRIGATMRKSGSFRPGRPIRVSACSTQGDYDDAIELRFLESPEEPVCQAA